MDYVWRFLADLAALGVWATVVLIIILKYSVQPFISEKAKNLATKQDIANITREIEGVKLQYAISLGRTSRVVERQIDILSKIYKQLSFALMAFQAMTRKASFAENEREVATEALGVALESAFDEFISGKLFLPEADCVQIESFFGKAAEGQTLFSLAKSELVGDAKQRVEFWDGASDVAFRDLPALLSVLEHRARQILHHGSD